MPLTVTVAEKKVSVFTVTPVGSIDTDTYKELERVVEPILEPLPSVTKRRAAGTRSAAGQANGSSRAVRPSP